MSRIKEIRAEEVKLLRKYIRLKMIGMHVADMGSAVCLLAFLFFYTIVYGATMTLAETYLVISFVNMLHMPSKQLSMAFDLLSNANVSLKRIENVVMTPDRFERPDDMSLKVGQVKFDNYSAGWFSVDLTAYFKTSQDKTNILSLQNLTFDFQPGKLYAVLGAVGSGKSSLLLSCLNDLVSKSGSVGKRGTVAFVSQSAFLLNASIKDNILFYNAYDESRYKMCLIKSCLLEDIQQLPGGDLTEIGERGINLSGG